MKKKTKRYQEGGEAEEKRRGLKASEGEKVGFLERLRMGNIDDPTSEAYKRLGAGRGRSMPAPDMTPYSETEDAKNLMRAAKRETQGALAMADTDVSGMDRYASEIGRGKMRDAPAPRATPKVDRERSVQPSAQDIDRLEAAATAARMRDERSRYMEGRDTPRPAATQTPKKTDEKKDSKVTRRGQRGERSGEGVMSRIMKGIKSPDNPRIRREREELERSKGMKAGGMVGSGASKRADGIAQRGKTRGRIV
jgi:hypothetical protein